VAKIELIEQKPNISEHINAPLRVLAGPGQEKRSASFRE
jgi:hypothetical protein